MKIQYLVLALSLFLSTACVSVTEPIKADPIQVETVHKSIKMWNNQPLPVYPDGQPEITILKITIQPGVSLPWHKHPVINAGILLSGELTVESDQGEKIVLQAGEAINELVDRWHHGSNTGSIPAEIIVFYAGTENQPLSISRNN